MAQKEAIMRALQEAMGGSSSAPSRSLRPKLRPPMIGGMPGGSTRGIPPKDNYSKEDLMRLLGESGKTISNADKAKALQGEAGKTLSDSDIKMLEQMMKQQQGARGAAERKAFPPASMMENGGEVKRKKKPKMGAVMKGRGGKYKGIK